MLTKIEKVLNFQTGEIEEFEVELNPFEQIAGPQTDYMTVAVPKNHQVIHIGDTANLVANDDVLAFLAKHQIEPQI